jgi:hypothetical protein
MVTRKVENRNRPDYIGGRQLLTKKIKCQISGYGPEDLSFHAKTLILPPHENEINPQG